MLKRLTTGNDSRQEKWFALKVRSCCEWKVAEYFQHLWEDDCDVNLEAFIPIQKAYKNPESGKVVYNQLVITNVLFLRFIPTSQTIDAIRHSSNVYDFYTIPGTNKPAPIPDVQIERLQDLLNESPNRVTFINSPKVGDYVEVVKGALRGLKGVIKKDLDGKERILIEVDFLGYACTEILRSDTIPCDIRDEKHEKRITRQLQDETVLSHLNSFARLYQYLSGLYLKRLSDSELCDLVSFYTVLINCSNALPVLRNGIWKNNRYCYQEFFANVYIELANRVKDNRNKQYRAPLIYALHCLCNQISERAYTIKTNVEWVVERAESIKKWFVQYTPKGNNYQFVRLILATAADEQSGQDLPETVNKHVSSWIGELQKAIDGVDEKLEATDMAQRLQLLLVYGLKTKDRDIVRKTTEFQSKLTAQILSSGAASDLILLSDVLRMIYRNKLTTTQDFRLLTEKISEKGNTVSALSLRAICELHCLEASIRK